MLADNAHRYGDEVALVERRDDLRREMTWRELDDDANRVAARYDAHPWGPWHLWQAAHWCGCGSPWDLEATPNFARMLEVNEVPWPPVSEGQYPLKDW